MAHFTTARGILAAQRSYNNPAPGDSRRARPAASSSRAPIMLPPAESLDWASVDWSQEERRARDVQGSSTRPPPHSRSPLPPPSSPAPWPKLTRSQQTAALTTTVFRVPTSQPLSRQQLRTSLQARYEPAFLGSSLDYHPRPPPFFVQARDESTTRRTTNHRL